MDTPHFGIEMQVTDLAEFVVQRLGSQPACGSTVIRWVPDMRPRFLQSENPNGRVKAPPQRICVKDLALESLLSLKDHQGTKRKKSNKVPTGGQPYFRHLKRNQKSNKSSSVGQQRNTDDSILRTRKHLVPVLHLWLQNEEDVTQESKRERALLETKEKLAAPFIVQKATSFDRSEAKIPMKDKDSGRSPARQTKVTNPPPQAAGIYKLQASPRMFAKRKSCVKCMEYKSNMTRLGMEGCDPFASCLPKAKFSYRQYCEHLASWKETTRAERDASDISREAWPEEDPQEAPKTFAPLQPPGPPPPPPSPFLFENSPNSPPGFT